MDWGNSKHIIYHDSFKYFNMDIHDGQDNEKHKIEIYSSLPSYPVHPCNFKISRSGRLFRVSCLKITDSSPRISLLTIWKCFDCYLHFAHFFLPKLIYLLHFDDKYSQYLYVLLHLLNIAYKEKISSTQFLEENYV